MLNLDSVLSERGSSGDQIMLILDDADGPWAVLVDELSSLQSLEVSDAPDADVVERGSAVIGWAMFGENVIQVLDQSRIRQFAEHALSEIWQPTDLRLQESNEAAALETGATV